MEKELETLDKLLTFAGAMSENMIGLSKGNYDENQFIKNTYEYLNKYSVDRHDISELRQALATKSKKEQAFDIIKKKCATNSNLSFVKYNFRYENYCKEFTYFLNKYNKCPDGFDITKKDLLTKEEYDLLREVL